MIAKKTYALAFCQSKICGDTDQDHPQDGGQDASGSM